MRRVLLLLAIVLACSFAAACEGVTGPDSMTVALTIPKCPLVKPSPGTAADSITAICRYDSTGTWIGW